MALGTEQQMLKLNYHAGASKDILKSEWSSNHHQAMFVHLTLIIFSLRMVLMKLNIFHGFEGPFE